MLNNSGRFYDPCFTDFYLAPHVTDLEDVGSVSLPIMNWCGDKIKGAGWILFTLIVFFRIESAQAQGLGFFSNDRLVRERTSYAVFAGNAPKFNRELTIAFDLSFYSKQQFGYIFTLIDPRNKSYSLSFRLEDDQTPWLHFNIDKEATKLKLPLEKSWIENGTWIPVEVHFNLETDQVQLKINQQPYQSAKLGLQPGIAPELIFGRYSTYTDVPAMAIRNLRLNGAAQDWLFPLNEWDGNAVHNSSGAITGKVDNPNWLIKEAHYWKKRVSHSFTKVAGASFIPEQNQVVAFTQDSLFSFQLTTGASASFGYENKLPISRLILARSGWDSLRQQLWVYEANNLPIGDTTIALLDIEKKRWTPIGTAYLPEQRHHHNLIQQDSSWILFGGYGSFRYFNGFYRYDSTTDRWQQLPMQGDSIDPRFFAAMGPTGRDGEFLLFGGFGNPTGEQVVGGRNYFDCYHVQIKERRIKKLWDKSLPEQLWVPASNLLMDADGSHFYVLGYPHHLPKSALQLYKFSVADGQFELVSDSIPITSEKIETEINLYRNAESGELVCLVQEFWNAAASNLFVYTLKDPPVAFNAQSQETGIWKGSGKWWWLLLLVPIALYWISRRKRTDLKKQMSPAIPVAKEEIRKEEIEQPQQNAVYLLGDFLAFDKKGMDISHLFSPKIRQLFLLLIVSNRAGKKGVGSRLISSTLWPERDMASTKNIRGVTINALRNILMEWEGIQLNYINDAYLLELEAGFFCDYYQVLDFLQQPNNEQPAPQLLAYLPLLQRGPLFTNLQEAFLDEYKFEYESLLVKKAAATISTSVRADNWNQSYYLLAKIIHMADPFHELALSYQLVYLRKTKGMEAARKKYEAFQAEYQRSLGQAFTPSFEQVAQV